MVAAVDGERVMAENSGIEWTDHIDPAAKGRVLGAYKAAANRCGLSVEEWMKRRADGLRRCYRCENWKPADRFSVDGNRRGGRASICKPCLSEASTASRYRMTREELAAFKAERGHRCEICCEAGRYVDHDHATGKVRGFLCANCNSAIGKLREDPLLFAATLAYLEKNRG